jgi:NADH-quinone oxidoreductase subunit C
MIISNQELLSTLSVVLGDRIQKSSNQGNELTLHIRPSDMLDVCTLLHNQAALKFTILIDVCGVDYSAYGDGLWDGPRFAAVYHLLSIEHNKRLRLKVFAENDDLPIVNSVVTIWPSAGWYEREAFDLYGIVFEGHPDLRRLLTDYGFIGHPFRKDFPLSGNVEMRYDPDQQRVIYQPVTIDPREVTPRIVRVDNYARNE